jgi:hypothetical protein
MDIIWAALPSWIALIIALITAMIAVFGLVQEGRLTKFTLGATLLVRLEDKFDETGMVAKRKRAAQALSAHLDPAAAREVLDFFEEIGILLQKGALDLDLVYNEFSYHAISYWVQCHDYIEKCRSDDPTWFCAYARLIDALDKPTREHIRWRPTDAQLAIFLRDESELVVC